MDGRLLHVLEREKMALFWVVSTRLHEPVESLSKTVDKEERRRLLDGTRGLEKRRVAYHSKRGGRRSKEKYAVCFQANKQKTSLEMTETAATAGESPWKESFGDQNRGVEWYRQPAGSDLVAGCALGNGPALATRLSSQPHADL